ncbi:hypothetical protein Y032_0021g396 [Ancylostoma ceylanicum]|uniref:Uncharacterized protein n=1 Tax=Ancylostoma ceylanicum TaxID=53326 RepID=A0A016UZ83_9BILA|nr:hypothetical protein Y032_0021g396 [Ancylostoma ceylanicum]
MPVLEASSKPVCIIKITQGKRVDAHVDDGFWFGALARLPWVNSVMHTDPQGFLTTGRVSDKNPCGPPCTTEFTRVKRVKTPSLIIINKPDMKGTE